MLYILFMERKAGLMFAARVVYGNCRSVRTR